MSTAKTDTLKVPGASLYYELTGSGPLQLMIPGAPADAGGFAPLVRHPVCRCGSRAGGGASVVRERCR
jgi:hypothetical protein